MNYNRRGYYPSFNNDGNWEWRNLSWLLLGLIPLFGCIAFFYIGSKAKQNKWYVAGIVHFLIALMTLIIFLTITEPFEGAGVVFYYMLVLAVLAIPMFILLAHAAFAAPEYLHYCRLNDNALQANGAVAYANYPQPGAGYPVQPGPPPAVQPQPRPVYKRPAGYPVQPSPPPAVPPQPQPIHKRPAEYPVNYDPAVAASKRAQLQPDFMPKKGSPVNSGSIKKLNLNRATEQQLTSLPGVGVVLSKRAVNLRQQTGPFLSVTDFCQKLGLLQHFYYQIENLAYAGPMPEKKTEPEIGRRVIDI